MFVRLHRSVFAVPFVIAALCLTGCEKAPTESDTTTEGDTASTASFEVTDRVVELSCGECSFGMKGNDCDLAVRIDGKSYFVDGKSIDDFGDSHAADGLCMAVRQAKVTGRVENGRFIATAIEVLPLEAGQG